MDYDDMLTLDIKQTLAGISRMIKKCLIYFFIMLILNFVLFGLLNGFSLSVFFMSLVMSLIGSVSYVMLDYLRI
ncbi:hypothetical protein B0682_03380 [Moraxella lincolnii]|uniref:Uncharacterized protein n=1 Tax=Lwoffella lincolnii TaxID=90241 RepID=A0A1T0CH58_9GAMM|nr:hypothetical protein B0682_03380 [Moraxella lincolnii]